FEALYSSYQRFIAVERDSNSSVSTLAVKAYRPEDAHRIARALLEFSEQLVNQLNERSRRDLVGAFQREVEETEQQIGKIQTQLTTYRIQQKMLDPKSAATGPLELLAQMTAQQTKARDLIRDGRRELSLGLRDRLAPDRERARTRLGLSGGATGCGGTGQVAHGWANDHRRGRLQGLPLGDRPWLAPSSERRVLYDRARREGGNPRAQRRREIDA